MDNFLSVVSPAFNEVETLPHFINATLSVLEKTGMNFELIIVDDGSTDGTTKVLKDACAKDERVKGIIFSRNFGQLPAIYCGFEKAKGNAVIVMDSDLQDDPALIPDLIAKWKEGYDVVNAVRTARQGETSFKKGTADMFTSFARKTTGLKIKDKSGEFKLYSSRVVNAILSLPERNKYLRTVIPWLGFKEADVFFDRPPRYTGKTKYNVGKLVALAEKAILPNTRKFFRIGRIIALSAGFCSILAFLTFIILAIFKIYLPLTAWLFPTVGLSLSVILFTNALRDEYIAFIYDEVKNRPLYVIGEEIGTEKKDG